MLFSDGDGQTLGTKLTGIISALGEAYPLNSAIWTDKNDLKLAWGYISLTASDATLNNGEGIVSVAREATGIVTVTWSVQFDNTSSVPAVFSIPVIQGNTSDDARFSWASSGAPYYHSLLRQTFFICDDSKNLVNGDLFVFAIGYSSALTTITDNSSQSPLNADTLNRVISIGNYRNPSHISDVCPVLTCGFSKQTTAPGDTLDADLGNSSSLTHNGTGDYQIDFTSEYLFTPLFGIVTPQATSAYPAVAHTKTTIDHLEVLITEVDSDTLANRNFAWLVVGNMEVS